MLPVAGPCLVPPVYVPLSPPPSSHIPQASPPAHALPLVPVLLCACASPLTRALHSAPLLPHPQEGLYPFLAEDPFCPVVSQFTYWCHLLVPVPTKPILVSNSLSPKLGRLPPSIAKVPPPLQWGPLQCSGTPLEPGSFLCSLGCSRIHDHLPSQPTPCTWPGMPGLCPGGVRNQMCKALLLWGDRCATGGKSRCPGCS